MVMSKGPTCLQRGMAGRPRGLRGVVGLWLVVSPFLALFFASSALAAVPASEACGSNLEAADWNKTVERLALVPFAGGYYPEVWWEEDVAMTMEDEEGKEPGSYEAADPALHPEEPWMYAEEWNRPPPPRLEPLTTSVSTLISIGNDSAGVLRVNLSADHRTTFCVTLTGTNAEGEVVPVRGDVYLLTDAEYDRYASSYQNLHGGGWGWWWDVGDGEILADRAPELRRYDPLGWTSYRDAHAYEDLDEVSFSLALDRPEVRTSFVDGENWDTFHLVIDAWDNGHGGDAEVSNAVVHADVAVVANERSFVMPPATVGLVMMAFLAALVAVPVVLQRKYATLGLDGGAD